MLRPRVASLLLCACALGCGAATGLDQSADLDAGLATEPLPQPDAAILVSDDDSGPPLVTEDAAAPVLSDMWCGFELGGSMNVSVVGNVVAAQTDGTEVKFIGLTCDGTTGGETYSFFADYIPGIELDVTLSSSKSTSTSSQACSTDATLNGAPVTMFSPYAIGDALTITFSSCETPADASVPYVTKGEFAAIISPEP